MLKDILFYLTENFGLFSLLLLVSPEIEKLMKLAKLLYCHSLTSTYHHPSVC